MGHAPMGYRQPCDRMFRVAHWDRWPLNRPFMHSLGSIDGFERMPRAHIG